jgi:ABC-2 type transport system permease protein
MKPLLRQALFRLKHLLRQPAYVVGSMVFPSLFFLFFAAPNADTEAKADLLLASFAGFSVLGIAFFQFGIESSQERTSAWTLYLKTLPISAWTILWSRAAVALVLALAAATVCNIVVLVASPAALDGPAWLRLYVALVLGGVPFCVLAQGLSHLAGPSAAVPLMNLVYLMSSYAGGLWIPPVGLPAVIQDVSNWMPTRAYGELVWAATSGRSWSELEARWWWLLLPPILIGLALQAWGSRQESR